MKSLKVIPALLLLSNTALAAGLAQSAFRAEGFGEKTKTADDKIISLKASVAEGMDALGAKTLYDPVIEIQTSIGHVKITGKEAFFKTSEVIVTGNAVVILKPKKMGDPQSNKIQITSSPPEDILYIDFEQNVITAPGATVKIKGQTYRGRGLAVDLQKRVITWVKSVTTKGKSSLKTPYDLKY